MRTIRQLDPSDTSFSADAYAPQIAAALKYAPDTYSVDDVIGLIKSRDAVMFECGGSIVVASIIEYPQSRSLSLWLGAGEMGTILDLLAHAESWGRMNNCSHAQVLGRKGWARALVDYDEAAVMLRRKL